MRHGHRRRIHLSNFSFYIRLRRTRRAIDADCQLPVYAAEGLPSPCMMLGKVYITDEAQKDLRHLCAMFWPMSAHIFAIWTDCGAC